MQLVLQNGKIANLNGKPIMSAGTRWRSVKLDPEVYAKQFSTFTKFLEHDKPIPPDITGQGIVTVCFGKRFWLMTLILVRLLRETGCQLPMQIWHAGEAGELDDPLTTLVDIRDHGVQLPSSLWDMWSCKTFAILHCGWQQVLYIDADAYFVADPTPLFEILDDTPFAYWQNFKYAESRVVWESVGIAGEDIPSVQGGQILIDVKRAWELITIADWINCQCEYYYRYCGFGDEDAYRIALAACKPNYRVIALVGWTNPAVTCAWQDKPMVVHRCGGKLFADSEPTWNMALPQEQRVQQLYTEFVNGN